MELSYISRVITTGFLIFLVLKDKNSSFLFPGEPYRVFDFFPFPGISFFTFSGWFFVAVLRLLLIWDNFFYSHVFFTLNICPSFGTARSYQGFPRSQPPIEVQNTDPAHLFVWITLLAKDISYSLVPNRRGVGIVGGGREGGVENLENEKSLISSGVGLE